LGLLRVETIEHLNEQSRLLNNLSDRPKPDTKYHLKTGQRE
jgi:hypothetical protein